jgi:hypothetical protein
MQSGVMAKTPQLPVKAMTAFTGNLKSPQPFHKSMSGVLGVVTNQFNYPKALQVFTKSMTGLNVAAMNKTLEYFGRSFNGVTGSVGGMSRSMQMLTTAKAGYVQVTGQSAKTLRLFGKSASGVISVSAAFVTVSMHTEKQALVSYTNYPFNSYCVFNGRVLAAGDGGLFELAGSTDNGTPITAIGTGGVTDFGDPHLKAIDRVHVGYRTDGDLMLTLIQHDDGQAFQYRLPSAQGQAGIFNRRLTPGRGLRARYYQWSISNVNGADFAIDSLELIPRSLSRRIGGTDA